MSLIRCRNCKWWGHFDSGFRANCNRYPPHPRSTMLSSKDSKNEEPFVVAYAAIRPEPVKTHGDFDFCGEFEEGESIERANNEEDAARDKSDRRKIKMQARKEVIAGDTIITLLYADLEWKCGNKNLLKMLDEMKPHWGDPIAITIESDNFTQEYPDGPVVIVMQTEEKE